MLWCFNHNKPISAINPIARAAVEVEEYVRTCRGPVKSHIANMKRNTSMYVWYHVTEISRPRHLLINVQRRKKIAKRHFNVKPFFCNEAPTHMVSPVVLWNSTPWEIVFYNTTGETMWSVLHCRKNGLTLKCLFAIFFLLWTFIRRWRGRDISVTWYHTYIEVFLFMLAMWLFTGPRHVLTYSSTSTAALAIGLIALIGLYGWSTTTLYRVQNSLSVVIALIIIYGTITPFLGRLPIFEDAAGLLNRDADLTGRADIWAKANTPSQCKKSFLGHGFGGFWTDNGSKLLK